MKRLLIILFLLFSYSYSHINTEAIPLFKAKCMICHHTYDKTNTAPPIVAINQIYTKATGNTIADKIKAQKMIVEFLQAPTKQKALMKPAIKLFGLMPKQDITYQQMIDFASIIIETDFEVPEWFGEHFKSHKLNLEHKEVNIP